MIKYLSILFFLFIYGFGFSQSDKLDVQGIVHSETGGFKFPDNTIQTTAAKNLTAEQTSDERGKVEIQYDGITGVLIDTKFKALSLSFEAELVTSVGGGLTEPEFGELMITHNVSAPHFPLFMIQFAKLDSIESLISSYFDSSDTKYMEIIYRSLRINEFSHFVTPLPNDKFGHTFNLGIGYGEIEISDVIGGECKCWNLKDNSTNCGCSTEPALIEKENKK